MSRFANVGMVPAQHRAQVEARLREGAAVRRHSIKTAADQVELPKPSKYRNAKCVYDGQRFDSLKEANRWRDLRLLERAREISGLRRQVAFELKVNRVEIAVYIADFCYLDKDWKPHTEDVKGYRKGLAYRMFRIKAALMLALHGVRVEEV